VSRRINIAVFLFILIAAGITWGQSGPLPEPRPGDAGAEFLGPHNNGGRGCAGCHAPHSGAASSANATTELTGISEPGSEALFAQEGSPLFSQALTFGNGYIEGMSSESAAYSTDSAEWHAIMMCLACHDGQIAKGHTATGKSWEELNGILPVGIYGTRPIPSLLGDANNSGYGYGYGNDHPVGKDATLGALGLVSANGGKPTDPLTVIVGKNGISNIFPTPGSSYAAFAANYGYPSIAGNARAWGVALPVRWTDSSKAFLTCATCHNQHALYIYQAPTGKQDSSAIMSGKYPTFFFVNAPYNRNTGSNDPTMTDSATQFCRQCHIGQANETYGVNIVRTQF